MTGWKSLTRATKTVAASVVALSLTMTNVHAQENAVLAVEASAAVEDPGGGAH